MRPTMTSNLQPWLRRVQQSVNMRTATVSQNRVDGGCCEIVALLHRGTEIQRDSRQGIAIIECAAQTLRSPDYRRNHHQTGLALKVDFLRCRIGSGFEGVATELDNLEVFSTSSKCDDFASFAMFLAIFAFQNTPMKRPEPMSRRPRRHRRLHPTLRVSVPLWFNSTRAASSPFRSLCDGSSI